MSGEKDLRAEADLVDIESSEDEITPCKSTSKSSAKPILSATTAIRNGSSLPYSDSNEDTPQARNVRRSKLIPIILSSDEAASQDPLTPQRRNISRPRQRRKTKSQDSPPGESTESSADPQRQKVSNSSKQARLTDPFLVADGGDDISSEDDVITPIRRRMTNARRSPATRIEPMGEEDSEDLQDEVEDLQDDSDIEIKDTRTRGRQRNSARSIRLQKLEELRRRRAGVQQDTEEEEEAEEAESFNEGDDNYSAESYGNDIGRGNNLDEYEEDFVDDDNETLGVDLGRAGVPLELTYHANKKTVDHFATEIEWMVHNKINPAFDRNDEIYLLAHDKLDYEFKGYAGSQYISSVWRQDFDKALKTRPEISRVEVPTMFEDKCDACNRSKHPPKHKVTFQGKAYDKNTLEPIGNVDDYNDSSDSESEESEVDEESFFLGRYVNRADDQKDD